MGDRIMNAKFIQWHKVFLTGLLALMAIYAFAGGLAPTGSGGGGSSSVSGSVSITGTPTVNINNSSIPMTYWELGAPITSVNTNIGSNTATNLQSLASFTAHELVTIQANSKIHFDKVGAATGTMQYADFMNNGDRVVWRVGTTSFDMALIGDTVGGNASISLKIYPLY